MSFIKNGDCEIINIITTGDGEVSISAEDTDKILKKTKASVKNDKENITEDLSGNKTESN